MPDKTKGRSETKLGDRANGIARISRRSFVGGSAGAALTGASLSTLLAPRKARGQTGSGTVVVMAWENYVDPEIQKRFHEATGIAIQGVAADSDQDMFTK